MGTLDTYFWSGLCAGLVDEQIFTLFNQSAHEQDVEARIHKLEIIPQMPVTGSNSGQSLPGAPMQIVGTSSQSGGIVMPAVPLNSSNAALPSQVELRAFPAITQTKIMRRKLQLYPAEGSVGAPATGGIVPNNRLNGAEFFDLGRGSTVVQEFTIREGEGIGFNFDASVAQNMHPAPQCWHATIAFQLSTGETYVTTSYLGSCPAGFSSFGLFNGSGSGVVIKLVSLTTTIMQAFSTVSLAYADDTRLRFSKVVNVSGVPSVGVPMQSNAPIATDVFGWQQLPWNPVNSSLNQLGGMRESGLNPNILGYPHANVMLVRGNFGSVRHQLSHMGSMLSASGGTGITDTDQYRDRTRLGLDFTRSRSGFRGMRLRAGEGLALIGSSNSPYPWWLIECTYTIHRPSKPAIPIAQLVS